MLFRQQKDWTIEEVVNRIISINEDNEKFWSTSHGWAPSEAADLLSVSRLDWQTSLSYTLKLWADDSLVTSDNREGALILAWTNLGSLVEGTMKLLLSVYYINYKEDEYAIMIYDKKKQTKVVAEPDSSQFDLLRQFFKKRVWKEKEAHWDDWILKIQQRRNAIHAYKTREINDFEEFYASVRSYLEFLQIITGRLPRP
jgi:hypothetical protein